MIHYRKGNLLQAKAEALVNAVNTVGVMGKGIALQFKNFSGKFKLYKQAADKKEYRTEKNFYIILAVPKEPKKFINFPPNKEVTSLKTIII